MTDFWWLTVVTISILKGLICGQKYLQQKDYNTSCKSFSIRFWKFVYSISLFTFLSIIHVLAVHWPHNILCCVKFTRWYLHRADKTNPWVWHWTCSNNSCIASFLLSESGRIRYVTHSKYFCSFAKVSLYTCEMHFNRHRLQSCKSARFETFSIAFYDLASTKVKLLDWALVRVHV